MIIKKRKPKLLGLLDFIFFVSAFGMNINQWQMSDVCKNSFSITVFDEAIVNAFSVCVLSGGVSCELLDRYLFLAELQLCSEA